MLEDQFHCFGDHTVWKMPMEFDNWRDTIMDTYKSSGKIVVNMVKIFETIEKDGDVVGLLKSLEE